MYYSRKSSAISFLFCVKNQIEYWLPGMKDMKHHDTQNGVSRCAVISPNVMHGSLNFYPLPLNTLKPAAVEHVYVMHECNIALRIHEFLCYRESRESENYRVLRLHQSFKWSRPPKKIALVIYSDFLNPKVYLILFDIFFFMTFLRTDAHRAERIT